MFMGSPIGNTGILFYRGGPPFSIDQIIRFKTDIFRGCHKGMDLHMPAVADFRALDLGSVPSVEINRYIMARSALGLSSAGPLAILCEDMRSQLVLRLYSVMAELAGLRNETDMMVTGCPEDAIAFVCDRAGIPKYRRDCVARKLRDLIAECSATA